MRQKIWCDRWIVKFGERNFETKHSLLCFYLILAMLIGVVYEGRKGEACEKVGRALIIMPLQGDKASKATQTRQTQACNAFPSCDRVAWSFSRAHWPLPLSRSIMAHSLIVLLWLVVVATLALSLLAVLCFHVLVSLLWGTSPSWSRLIKLSSIDQLD